VSDPALTLRCYNDKGRLACVGRHRTPGRHLVRLFWCPYCAEGVVVVGEDDSYKVAGRCRLDDKAGPVTVSTSHPHEDVTAAVAALGRQLYDRLKRKP
jgi:hypothetical protein